MDSEKDAHGLIKIENVKKYFQEAKDNDIVFMDDSVHVSEDAEKDDDIIFLDDKPQDVNGAVSRPKARKKHKIRINFKTKRVVPDTSNAEDPNLQPKKKQKLNH